MFPIRSLTPQQATGNALATGFKLSAARRGESSVHAVIHYLSHFTRGDQDVLIHPLTFSYNILKFDPFALITQILLLPLPLELKARYLPSGDQDGDS